MVLEEVANLSGIKALQVQLLHSPHFLLTLVIFTNFLLNFYKYM